MEYGEIQISELSTISTIIFMFSKLSQKIIQIETLIFQKFQIKILNNLLLKIRWFLFPLQIN